MEIDLQSTHNNSTYIFCADNHFLNDGMIILFIIDYFLLKCKSVVTQIYIYFLLQTCFNIHFNKYK